MRKVVFLDRDGVINDDTGHYYIFKPEDFKFNVGIEDAVKLIAQKGYEIIVITNQGGIARGTYTKANVDKVHQYMVTLFQKQGVTLLDIYYCPQHNKFESCLCRKPSGLMLKKAIARYNIDTENSFMIGDNVKDVEAAQNAGIRGFKIEKNSNIFSLVSQLLNE